MAQLSTAPVSRKERARLIIRARLLAQGLVTPAFSTARDAVAAFGAMQGKDVPGLISSLALLSEEIPPCMSGPGIKKPPTKIDGR